MLKPWRGQEKFPFSFETQKWWLPQLKGGGKKMYFPAKRLGLVAIKRLKDRAHFYLSIGQSKKG